MGDVSFLKCNKGPVECSILEDSDGPFEPLLELQVSNEIRLIGDVKKEVIADLEKDLIIENPEWVKNDRLNISNHATPRQLAYLEQRNGYWTMPQGYLDQLLVLLQNHNCAFLTDFPLRTAISDLIDYEFHGELRPDQEKAAEAALFRHYGVMCLPTGSGKTVTALHCIAKRRQTALVVVHRTELLHQWQDEITKFLGITKSEIGVIGGGKERIGEKITVAMMQTLMKRDLTELVNKTSLLVVDECHHVPANQFRTVVDQFRCRYMLGLSATPERTDGLDKLIHFYMGDLCYYDGSERSFRRGDTLRPIVHPVQTRFNCDYSGDYAALLREIAEDRDRLKLLVEVVAFFIVEGGTPLIVSDRKDHCRRIAMALENASERFKVGLVTSDVQQTKREQIINDIKSGELDALVATGGLIGEGFDCKRLDGLFLATPFKAATKVKQMVGRIVRTDEGKKTPEIYDFVDKVWKCQDWYRDRLEVYKAEGYNFAPGAAD